MFDKEYIRKYIFVAWVLVFLGMWFTFQTGLPRSTFAREINSLQESIVQENWAAAKQKVTEINNYWKKINYWFR